MTPPETEPAVFAHKQAAVEAHARYVEHMMEALAFSQRALIGENAAPAIDAAAREAVNKEAEYTTYLVDSLQSVCAAVYVLINEMRNDRFCAAAAVVALSKQKYCNHEKFRLDFIELAETMYGGAHKVPPHVHDVSKMIEAQGARKES
jgi:hypothetical protein